MGVAGLVTPVAGLTDPANYMPVPWLVQSLWVLALGVTWTIRLQVAATVPVAELRDREPAIV
jgi:hypothetical protein